MQRKIAVGTTPAPCPHAFPRSVLGGAACAAFACCGVTSDGQLIHLAGHQGQVAGHVTASCLVRSSSACRHSGIPRVRGSNQSGDNLIAGRRSRSRTRPSPARSQGSPPCQRTCSPQNSGAPDNLPRICRSVRTPQHPESPGSRCSPRRSARFHRVAGQARGRLRRRGRVPIRSMGMQMANLRRNLCC